MAQDDINSHISDAPAQTDAPAVDLGAQESASQKKPKKGTGRVRIDPRFSYNKNIVDSMVNGIARAIKSSDLLFSAKPGPDRAFKEFEGESDGHKFIIKYVQPAGDSMYDDIYVAYDNFEFQIQQGSLELGDLVKNIDNHVNENYIYDFATRKYVPRPIEPKTIGGFFTKIFGKAR